MKTNIISRLDYDRGRLAAHQFVQRRDGNARGLRYIGGGVVIEERDNGNVLVPSDWRERLKMQAAAPVKKWKPN